MLPKGGRGWYSSFLQQSMEAAWSKASQPRSSKASWVSRAMDFKFLKCLWEDLAAALTEHSELWMALQEFPIHQAAATRCQKRPAQPCTEPFHAPLSTPAQHCTPRAKGNACPGPGMAGKNCPGASSYHGSAVVGAVMGGKQIYWDWRK